MGLMAAVSVAIHQLGCFEVSSRIQHPHISVLIVYLRFRVAFKSSETDSGSVIIDELPLDNDSTTRGSHLLPTELLPDSDRRNQCVFLRGYRIADRSILFLPKGKRRHPGFQYFSPGGTSQQERETTGDDKRSSKTAMSGGSGLETQAPEGGSSGATDSPNSMETYEETSDSSLNSTTSSGSDTYWTFVSPN